MVTITKSTNMFNWCDLESDEFYGRIELQLDSVNPASYIVRIWTHHDNDPFISQSFGNGVSAEDFLLKVLCNPTFYKLKYS